MKLGRCTSFMTLQKYEGTSVYKSVSRTIHSATKFWNSYFPSSVKYLHVITLHTEQSANGPQSLFSSHYKSRLYLVSFHAHWANNFPTCWCAEKRPIHDWKASLAQKQLPTHYPLPPTPTPNFLDSPASVVVGDWSQYAVEVDLSVALHEVHRKSRPFHQRSTNGRVSQCNKPTVGRLLQVLRFTRLWVKYSWVWSQTTIKKISI